MNYRKLMKNIKIIKIQMKYQAKIKIIILRS